MDPDAVAEKLAGLTRLRLSNDVPLAQLGRGTPSGVGDEFSEFTTATHTISRNSHYS